MKNFYFLTILICLGCLTSKAQGERILFVDNFGSYTNGESLSSNNNGWYKTGVGDFANKINPTFGAMSSSCFAQLATTGAASAYQEYALTAGETYVFKAYLKTTNNRIYSTIRINVNGTDVAKSGYVSANYTWEELSINYTPSVNETAKFIIKKTQGQVLNVDKVKIICSSCSDKKVVYDFHDSKESWFGAGCNLGLNDKGVVLNATSNTAIARSGDLTQDLNLNTVNFNKAKITFKTPYAMGGGGFGKFFLYDLAGGNTQFATYDFVRDPSNTTTFQTVIVDLYSPVDGTYSGNIARIGVRAPWGIQIGGKAYIQKIELYNDNILSLKEITSSNYQVELYPNPTSNSITLNLDGVSIVDVELLDIQGKLLLSQKQVYNQQQINLTGVATGTYFLRIISDQGNQQIKVRVK